MIWRITQALTALAFVVGIGYGAAMFVSGAEREHEDAREKAVVHEKRIEQTEVAVSELAEYNAQQIRLRKRTERDALVRERCQAEGVSASVCDELLK